MSGFRMILYKLFPSDIYSCDSLVFTFLLIVCSQTAFYNICLFLLVSALPLIINLLCAFIYFLLFLLFRVHCIHQFAYPRRRRAANTTRRGAVTPSTIAERSECNA